MIRPRNQAANERTRQILEDLEAVRENLLALSDDVWLSIDHNDPQALEEGVEFKRAYNEKMAAFDQVAVELSAMIQEYTAVRLEAAEQTGGGDRERNDRIVAELNREEPHSINEDFTFKRPHGFILDGQGANGITTWRRVYELLCRQLLGKDRNRFHALPDNPDFISNRGNRSFSRDPGQLRSPGLIGDGIHAEINLSANMVRDLIRRLLIAFEIPVDRLKLFLRQDRDAGREGHGT
jgi:hypothetical protein